MLPIEDLNIQDYQEILQKAKENIRKIYPNWSHWGASDSAMTLLELFAWLAEMQQFHAVQLGGEHTLAFLRLHGIDPRGIHPARIIVQAASGKRETFLRGTKGQTGGLIFESEDSVYLEPEGLLKHEYKIPFYPFGKNPAQQAHFDIPLTQALKQDKVHCLQILVKEDYPVRRNPINRESFEPLVQLRMEYYDGRRFLACSLTEDSTFGLLQTGIIQYRIPGYMGTWKGMYWLRLSIEGEYDTAPVIMGIYCNRIPMLQKDSKIIRQELTVPYSGQLYHEIILDTFLSVYGSIRAYQKVGEFYRRISGCRFSPAGEKRILQIPEKSLFRDGQKTAVVCVISAEEENTFDDMTYQGDGTAGQKIYLPHKNVLGREFAVWVEEAEGCFTEWHAVPSLFAAGRHEKCYLLREEEGMLEFGDGTRGMCPVGRIQIVSYVLCEGADGNIQKGQELTVRAGEAGERLWCPAPASGGRSPETIEDCIRRCRTDMEAQDRAVTNRDFEQLILRTPGLRIRSARVTPSPKQDNCLDAVFLPYTNDGRILQGDGYAANIMQYLEKRKLLGIGIHIKQTIYIDVLIHLEITVKQFFPGVQEQIAKQLQQYFEDHMDFGRTILYSRLYAFVETMAETDRICELTLRARGKGAVREPNNDILIPPEGIGRLEDLHLKVRTS